MRLCRPATGSLSSACEWPRVVQELNGFIILVIMIEGLVADGLGAKGFPDLRLGLKELVSDGLGAKGLPDLRLGLALAFVLTTPLATLCIEHILSCPVWRVSLPIARCFTGGTVGSGLSSAVAPVLHTLGRIRWLPVAGSGPRGRVSSLPAAPSVLVTGLAAPSRVQPEERHWLVGGCPLRRIWVALAFLLFWHLSQTTSFCVCWSWSCLLGREWSAGRRVSFITSKRQSRELLADKARNRFCSRSS